MVSQALKGLKITAGALCVLLLLVVGNASAANPQPIGIVVTPAIKKVVLRGNETTASFAVKVTNTSASLALMKVTTRDFTASSNGKQLTFVPATSDGSSKLHSLSKSLNVGLQQFPLAPGISQNVPVIIENANKLNPGGHYAAIIFNVQGLPNARSTVGVREAVSCLVFVDTATGGTQSISLAPVPVNHVVLSLPKSVDVVLTNQGNTETVPRGFVQIVGPKNHVISQGIINTDSGMILPGSSRLFPVSLRSIGSHTLIGTYHLKIYYRHDGQTTFNIYDKEFLLINIPIIVATVALVCVVCLVAVWAIKLLLRKRSKSKSMRPEEKVVTKIVVK